MAYADKTLYITDLDGTLLRSDKTLSEYTVREINARIERGMLFSAASARSLMGIYMVPVEAIHFPVPLVLMNGVLLYDLSGGRILESFSMTSSLVGSILEICRGGGKEPFLYRIRDGKMENSYLRVTSEGERVFMEERRRQFPGYFQQVERYDTAQEAVYFSMQDRREILESLKEQILRLSGAQCVLYRDTYLPDNWYLEVYSSHAGKGNGLRRLKTLLGVKHVVAFGDNLNDLPLFEEADVRCAVNNGADELKEQADILIASNDEDGVARYISKVFP